MNKSQVKIIFLGCPNQKILTASGLADNMYSGKSHLLTGAAWDRTLGWLINRNNKTLSQVVADSKEWGNYQNDTFSNTTGFIKTGEFNQTKALNIYDLAGNVDEWTSENSSDSSAPCVCRGGFNGNTGDYEPADVRVQWMDSPRDNFGFSVALFL